jgi:hypothetical protein
MVSHEVGALNVVILGHYLWCGSNMQCAHKRVCKSSTKVSMLHVILSNVMIQIILLFGFWWGNLRERDHLETGINGRIILKWIYKMWNEEARMGLA